MQPLVSLVFVLGVVMTGNLATAFFRTTTAAPEVEEAEAEGGETGAGCICPTIYAPVCTQNNRTFASVCELECANTSENPGLAIRCEHECPCPRQLQCMCPKIFRPVCSSGGMTYPNACALKCAQRVMPSVTMACNTACPCEV